MTTPHPHASRLGVVGLGAVGSRVVRQLHEPSDPAAVLVHDRRVAVAQSTAARFGATVVATVEAMVAARTVVLATPPPHALDAALLLANGVSVVSCSDDLDDVRNLCALGSQAARHGVRLVPGAAMSPGLSGLVAGALSARLTSVDEIHVAAHGTGGPACAHAHHHASTGTALDWRDGAWARRPAGSGRELLWFPEPVGAYDCYRAEMADPVLLHLAFPAAERITARLSATRRDRLTARLPMLSPPHPEGGVGALRVEVRGDGPHGRRSEVVGVAERSAVVAAAVCTAVAAGLGAGWLDLPPGLCVLGANATVTDRLLDDIARRGIHLLEFAPPSAASAAVPSAADPG